VRWSGWCRTSRIDEETSQTNIALLQQYGANSWRVHNYLLEANSKQLEKAVEDLTQLTTDLNRDRKNSQVHRLVFWRNEHRLTDLRQTAFGAQLTALETRWTELISNVLQIEMANVALEAEIDQLIKKEAELAIS